MFQQSINVIVATLAMSLFFAGCGDQNKKVKIPIRQVKTTPDGRKVKCDIKKDKDCKNEIVTEQITAKQESDKKAVEEALSKLKLNDENRLKLGELPSGKYELVGLSTSFEILQGTDNEVESVGIVSDFKVEKGSNDAPALSTTPEATFQSGTSSQFTDAPAYVNVLTSFDLNVDDKGVAVTKEYFQSATLELKANVSATKAFSNDNIKAEHQTRASNLDYITTAGSDLNVTEFKSSTLSKDGKIVASAAKDGSDTVVILVTFKKDSTKGEALHSVYATYKVTKANEVIKADASGEKVKSQDAASEEAGSEAEKQTAEVTEENPLAGADLVTGS